MKNLEYKEFFETAYTILGGELYEVVILETYITIAPDKTSILYKAAYKYKGDKKETFLPSTALVENSNGWNKVNKFE